MKGNSFMSLDPLLLGLFSLDLLLLGPFSFDLLFLGPLNPLFSKTLHIVFQALCICVFVYVHNAHVFMYWL